MGEKLVDGQVTTTCKNRIVPNSDGKRGHARSAKVTRMAAGDPKGASYLFGEIEDAAGNINTDAQQMCRCPETDLVISPPGGFRFFEVGKGRSKSDTCARNAQGRTNPRPIMPVACAGSDPSLRRYRLVRLEFGHEVRWLSRRRATGTTDSRGISK